jgi:predicted transcriptional regulator
MQVKKSPQNALRKWREQVGLSRLQLARVLNVTQMSVWNYENGTSPPRKKIKKKIEALIQG